MLECVTVEVVAAEHVDTQKHGDEHDNAREAVVVHGNKEGRKNERLRDRDGIDERKCTGIIDLGFDAKRSALVDIVPLVEEEMLEHSPWTNTSFEE
ncbi:hypothetical protein V6N12_059138 [Hibiscus sabdariffa]|uniref:Uncharacterized protein n=1 Tax=Hibiscus sabdariffa TaxID=183260 RepID=A0ABR2EUR8_9ROSI